jgi:hypothetical protein
MTVLALLAPLFGLALVLLLQVVEVHLLGNSTASAPPATVKPTNVP